jgi:hypothetical protein
VPITAAFFLQNHLKKALIFKYHSDEQTINTTPQAD